MFSPSDLENGVDYIHSITTRMSKDYKDVDIPYIKELTEKNIENTFDEIMNAVLLHILLDITILLSRTLRKKNIKEDQLRNLPEKLLNNNLVLKFYDKIYDNNKRNSFLSYFKDKRHPRILAPWFIYVFHRTEDKAIIDDNNLWSIDTADYKNGILPHLAYYKNAEKEKIARHLIIDLKKFIQHLHTNDQDINKSLCLYLLNIKTALISTVILASYTDGNKIKPVLRRKYLHLGKCKLRTIPEGEYKKIKERLSAYAKEIEIDNRMCMAKLISPGIVFRFLGNKERDHYLYNYHTASAIYRIQKSMSDLIKFCLFRQSNQNSSDHFDNLYQIYTYLKNFDPYSGNSGLIKELADKLNCHEKIPLDEFIHSYERFGEVFKKTGKMKDANMWF